MEIQRACGYTSAYEGEGDRKGEREFVCERECVYA